MNSVVRSAGVGLLTLALCNISVQAASLAASLKDKGPQLKSAGPLTFGPEGILFVGDTADAAIYALATDDQTPAPANATLKVERINEKIAAALGTTPQQIMINDLAVNPISHKAYLAVTRGQGPDAKPVLVRVGSGDKLDVWPLDNVRFSRAALPDAPAATAAPAAGNRQQNSRKDSITDLAYVGDRLLVAGLSNEEFSSSLRSIPFPFQTVNKGTSAEIYHGAHGRFETRSPIRTFVPFDIADEKHLLAAYTCTPLVSFPISALKPGTHLKGNTIAELGNRNQPLDMIAYRKDGKDFILLANNSRGVMKITTENIDKSDPIVAPVPDGNKKGLTYETIAEWKGVEQLDQLDKDHALVIRSKGNGALDLEALVLP
ncbi:MAG: hypothetical protein EXS30_10085 [Pedosphaera sp.]|nr:hypothetical protein [Pedosphaera sp.]